MCLDLGLRFFPVAAIIAFRAYGSFSANWTYAAAMHGVPFQRYFFAVLGPQLWRSVAATVLLVALLALADVGTVLLLHPPGQASLPLAIFTIMANAPESLVASLCLIYLAIAIGLLSVLSWWPRRHAT